MDYTAPKTDFPERGDNFVTLGPWRIQSGPTWHAWQLAAQEAHIRASRAQADELNTRRIERQRNRLKVQGPTPVRMAAPPTTNGRRDTQRQPRMQDVPPPKLRMVNSCSGEWPDSGPALASGCLK